MKLMIFAVHDSAVGAYLQPFFARANGEALRSFASAVNSEDHQFAKHAEDFTLFRIGEFDDATGVILPLAAPTSLGSALEYRSRDGAVRPVSRPIDSRQIDIEEQIREVTGG